MENKAFKLTSGTRRCYQNYGRYTPPSGWQLYGPKIVAWGTVGLCVGGFLYHHYSTYRYTKFGDRSQVDLIEQNFVNSRENVRQGRWWTLITSSLMHFEAWHLAANMFGLVSFGPRVVQIFGAGGFVGLWLGSAAACGAAQIMWEVVQEQELRKKQKDRIRVLGYQLVKEDPTRSITFTRAIGASGSVLGIITAAGCFQPHMVVNIFPIPVGIPAWGAGLMFATFSVSAMVTGLIPGWGHAGHLGGMAFGAAYYYTWLRRRLRVLRF